MEKLKNIKDNLTSLIQSEIVGNAANVDTKELGEAVDMLKDLSEAIYYCSVTKAMEEYSEDKEKHMMMPEREPMFYPNYRDMDMTKGRRYYDDMYPRRYPMYYEGRETYDYQRNYSGGSNGGSSSSGGSGGSSSGNSGGSRSFYEMPFDIRDPREGKSSMMRKNYMESKEMHHDKNHQMKELEKYAQELTQDITEMIQDASPEEKQMLQQKIATLATKIK